MSQSRRIFLDLNSGWPRASGQQQGQYRNREICGSRQQILEESGGSRWLPELEKQWEFYKSAVNRLTIVENMNIIVIIIQRNAVTRRST